MTRARTKKKSARKQPAASRTRKDGAVTTSIAIDRDLLGILHDDRETKGILPNFQVNAALRQYFSQRKRRRAS